MELSVLWTYRHSFMQPGKTFVRINSDNGVAVKRGTFLTLDKKFKCQNSIENLK
jgi:hypothetical protein